MAKTNGCRYLFSPKGSSIEIINLDNHNLLAVDVLPMTTDMLKSFTNSMQHYLLIRKDTLNKPNLLY